MFDLLAALFVTTGFTVLCWSVPLTIILGIVMRAVRHKDQLMHEEQMLRIEREQELKLLVHGNELRKAKDPK